MDLALQQARSPHCARGARGLNCSDLHLDVMIGTDDFATAWTDDGGQVALLVDGTWQP